MRTQKIMAGTFVYIALIHFLTANYVAGIVAVVFALLWLMAVLFDEVEQ